MLNFEGIKLPTEFLIIDKYLGKRFIARINNSWNLIKDQGLSTDKFMLNDLYISVKSFLGYNKILRITTDRP